MAATRSWVYQYSEKIEKNGKVYFRCKVELKNGGVCKYKASSVKGQTTNIASHLMQKHALKCPTKQNQSTLDQFALMRPTKRTKTFRNAFAELVAKQYLPFSLIGEKELQDSYLAFLEEYKSSRSIPTFVTDKTVASDIG